MIFIINYLAISVIQHCDRLRLDINIATVKTLLDQQQQWKRAHRVADRLHTF